MSPMVDFANMSRRLYFRFMNNRTTTFLIACLCAPLWSCAPLHARSISDATNSWQDDSRGTAFAYDGFLYAWPANSSAPAGVPLLRTGAHFTVERVLANHEPMVSLTHALAVPPSNSTAPAIAPSSRHFPGSSCRLARGEIHRQRRGRYRPDRSSRTIREPNARATQDTLGCAHSPR